MEKKSVIKIGIFAILAIALLVWGLSFLKGNSLFSSSNNYVAIYSNLDGLAESNPVMLSGYKIGNVSSISFSEENNEMKIIVGFRIDKDFKLPKGCKAKIYNVDILGTKGVEIVRPAVVNGYLENGDTLIGVFDGGVINQVVDFIMPMKDNLAGLLSSTEQVMGALRKLLTDDNINNLNQTFNDLGVLCHKLSQNSQKIDNMLTNFDKAGKALGDNSENISSMIQNFSDLSDTLNTLNISQTLAEAQLALQNVNQTLNTLNNGNGTAQKILNSDSIYNNLETATNKINDLLSDFEAHPKKYINLAIFGGKEKKKKE